MQIGYHDENAMSGFASLAANYWQKGADIGKYPLPTDLDLYLPPIYIINPTPNEIKQFLKEMQKGISSNPGTKFFFFLPDFIPSAAPTRREIQEQLGKIHNLEFLTLAEADKFILEILDSLKPKKECRV